MPDIARRSVIAGGGLIGASAIIDRAGAEPGPPGRKTAPARMYELAYELGVAKNRQDVPAALAFMHDDMVLTSPAWGAVARGKAENAALLTRFFGNYPDYEVAFEDHVADGGVFVGWGEVRMTMAADATDAEGMTPNGRRIEVPVTIRMTFKDDLIATEDFSCDLAQIAAQSGISIDGMWRNVFGALPQAPVR